MKDLRSTYDDAQAIYDAMFGEELGTVLAAFRLFLDDHAGNDTIAKPAADFAATMTAWLALDSPDSLTHGDCMDQSKIAADLETWAHRVSSDLLERADETNSEPYNWRDEGLIDDRRMGAWS